MKTKIFIIFLISFVFLISLVSASEFGYNYLESINADRLGGFDTNFFMPLNKSVSGNFSFNGDCSSGGIELRDDGTICGQKLEVFNISSVDVTKENITITNDMTIKGNVTASWFRGLFNWTAIGRFLSFNGWQLSFDEDLLNATIDDKISENNNSVNNYILYVNSTNTGGGGGGDSFWTNDTSEDNLINSTGANIKTGNVTYGTIINSSLNQIYIENTETEYIIWI